ncbi:MAG: hypothetical protein IPJ93_04480 [Bacteroidota bacterium]|nr:MAG: hypothetical protein IPJ93_04480 [Bacteroidota bacterium]
MVKNKLADHNHDYSLVILTTSATKFDETVFSADELKYMKNELKDKKILLPLINTTAWSMSAFWKIKLRINRSIWNRAARQAIR